MSWLSKLNSNIAADRIIFADQISVVAVLGNCQVAYFVF